MKRRTKILAAAAGAILLLYVGSFFVLAKHGGYKLLPSGHYRAFMGLMQSDTWMWQPRYGIFFSYLNASGEQAIMADNLGYFFGPLIWTEQRFFRPPVPFFKLSEKGELEGPAYTPPIEQLHPESRKIVQDMLNEKKAKP